MFGRVCIFVLFPASGVERVLFSPDVYLVAIELAFSGALYQRLRVWVWREFPPSAHVQARRYRRCRRCDCVCVVAISLGILIDSVLLEVCSRVRLALRVYVSVVIVVSFLWFPIKALGLGVRYFIVYAPS